MSRVPPQGHQSRSANQPQRAAATGDAPSAGVLSPGQIMKRQVRRRAEHQHRSLNGRPAANATQATQAVPVQLFEIGPYAHALRERGVRLAPLIVQWDYDVRDARAFSKWLKTREIILSDARMAANANTDGIHYFGTYLTPDEGPADQRARGALPGEDLADAAGRARVGCQTIWGFSRREAMEHMFSLCRGDVQRVSIVETDLRDFVMGLKAQINAARGTFSQTVRVAPSV